MQAMARGLARARAAHQEIAAARASFRGPVTLRR
jgi:hypothetical protein